ncbi:MAG: hypothetical protein ACR2NC_00420 [Thermodesulfobacteriota bacterium]
MKLEDLIKEQERKESEELSKALDIADREWENIRTSLELCGDIGKFSKEDFMVGIIDEDVIIREPLNNPTKSVSGYSPTFYPMYFLRDLLVMDDKLSDKGYQTIEAMYVFIELATQAVSRLGLDGNFAMGFGSGYGYVRTGWIAEKGWAVEREIFYKEFFKGTKINYDWDFFWNSVKEKFLNNFKKFENWKKDPDLYLKESKSKAKVKPLLV